MRPIRLALLSFDRRLLLKQFPLRYRLALSRHLQSYFHCHRLVLPLRLLYSVAFADSFSSFLAPLVVVVRPLAVVAVVHAIRGDDGHAMDVDADMAQNIVDADIVVLVDNTDEDNHYYDRGRQVAHCYCHMARYYYYMVHYMADDC